MQIKQNRSRVALWNLAELTAMNDPDEFAALDALIMRLNDPPLLSKAKAAERHHPFIRAAINRMIEHGGSLGQASGNLAIYNQSEEAFKVEIRKTDNDLNGQIARFNFGLDRWFEYGESHPPYFPWRIAIILSKRREVDREKRFLASYCRHFWDRKGNTDEKIVARAEKKGAF